MFGAATGGITALALVAATSLVLLTSYLHRTALELASATESVRAAEEGKAALLMHPRTRDPAARRELAANLQARLREAGQYVTTAAEAQILIDARERVGRYLGVQNAGTLEEAYRATSRLVDINLAQAREAEHRAARLDRAANTLGAATGVLLITLAAALVWWLRVKVFRPASSLARAMRSYQEGDEQARAVVEGPRELRDLARRFNGMARALGARRQRQMTFLAAIAHDLRNPLTVLKTSMALLGGRQPPSPPGAREIVARAARQITRLERMTGDIIETSRIEAGKLELKLDWQDVRELIRFVVELFEEAAEHELRLVLPPAPVMLRCDPLRIEQILTNLIANAIKYSPAGSIVEVELRTAAGDAVISVRDQGVGISPEDQSQVFEPFRRVGLTQDSIPGVGMGLFVVRRLVEAHGGRVEVESTQGRGSTFRVLLPLGGQPAKDAAGCPAPVLRTDPARL